MSPDSATPTDSRLSLVAALADFYVGHPDADRFPMLAKVGGHLTAALANGGLDFPESQKLPVARLVSGTRAEINLKSHIPEVETVLETFAAATPSLRWIQTPGYAATLPQHYLDNYGYVRIIGRGGLVESSVVSSGLGVWGAGLHYPQHEHPAEETYHVLHGSVHFQRAEGDWHLKTVGESVHHQPWERHAQKFGDKACVMLWAWTGDVGVDARLTGSQSQASVGK
ncbi:MAG: dimethylsulfonioproprionate lyase family protein [Acidimicrobiales bacterium]|nr:dimethylsulfonioproprionate lyase family protein [Acidimicrobiales bacterium]